MSSEQTGSNYTYFYKDHAETCDPLDFWGQVKRTVNGKPVSKEQIDMIIATVSANLALNRDDCLLDICCGNGALSIFWFEMCVGGLGVDLGEYLIKVAQRHFEKKPTIEFRVGDAVDYSLTENFPERFTKVVCYGSFQYLPFENSETLLKTLRIRFTNIKRVFIGNCPDKSKLSDFYYDGKYIPGIEDDHTSPIGIWRSKYEFTELAANTGWQADFQVMPETFYSSKYRYDVILKPLK